MDSYVLTRKALQQIHNHSFENHEEIKKSIICYCFYCKEASASSQVEDWADEDQTALCPLCGIDAVVGDAAGFEMTPALLQTMHEFWFEQKFVGDDFDWGLLEPTE